jgi:hypothetical protein
MFLFSYFFASQIVCVMWSEMDFTVFNYEWKMKHMHTLEIYAPRQLITVGFPLY